MLCLCHIASPCPSGSVAYKLFEEVSQGIRWERAVWDCVLDEVEGTRADLLLLGSKGGFSLFEAVAS